MVEDWILLGFGAILMLVGSMIGGFVAKLVIDGIMVASIERRIKRLENTLISPQGVAVRQKKAERESEAFAALGQAIMAKLQANPNMKKEDAFKEALIEVGPQYLDVALSYGGKLLQGKKTGLEALIGGEA